MTRIIGFVSRVDVEKQIENLDVKKRDEKSSRFISSPICKIKHVQLCRILSKKYIHTFS